MIIFPVLVIENFSWISIRKVLMLADMIGKHMMTFIRNSVQNIFTGYKSPCPHDL